MEYIIRAVEALAVLLASLMLYRIIKLSFTATENDSAHRVSVSGSDSLSFGGSPENESESKPDKESSEEELPVIVDSHAINESDVNHDHSRDSAEMIKGFIYEELGQIWGKQYDVPNNKRLELYELVATYLVGASDYFSKTRKDSDDILLRVLKEYQDRDASFEALGQFVLKVVEDGAGENPHSIFISRAGAMAARYWFNYDKASPILSLECQIRDWIELSVMRSSVPAA